VSSLKKKKAAERAEAPRDRYVNREFSWLMFNKRVLEEAENPRNPVLERLKFLAIFESNLDEFYMVRVSGLIEQHEGGVIELTPDGLTPDEQLRMIAATAMPLRRQAAAVWREQLHPELDRAGVHARGYEGLPAPQREELDEHFLREVFPVCTPLVLDPAPSVPFISNRSLNLAVDLHHPKLGARLGRVKVPDVLPRFVRLGRRKHDFVFLEDLLRHNLHHLFPGVEIRGAHPFRVIRDADVEIRELEAADLIESIEESLRRRRFGDPVLLEVCSSMPPPMRSTLMRLLELDPEDVFEVNGLLGMGALWELTKLEKPALRFPVHHPFVAEPLATSDALFQTVSGQDVLVFHPYDSFRSVEELVRSAARDPNVIGIKQTLYRVGAASPVLESLLEAAEAGKQVAVMVELKARFDESNNIEWARALERAGAHVSYGFADVKTHAKLCLVVRRENGIIRRYAHIGTGNYNPFTARIYTDIGLFTCDPEITQDVSELFNVLTGFAKQKRYRRLLVGPTNLREGIVERVRREIEQHRKRGGGRLLFKLNALVDPEMIELLYEASAAGVKVDLNVRGICCLRPGVPGLSDNVRVVSIVGRFLEHARVYHFENGGSPEALIGSADLMRRNLDRRVETLVPVTERRLVELLRDLACETALRDNLNCWDLGPDGAYVRRQPPSAQEEFQSQSHLMGRPMSRVQLASRHKG
jgi:polyphosphate kinase